MFKSITARGLSLSVSISLLCGLGFSDTAFAQLGQPVEIETTNPVKVRRVIKNVEPVPYWVDADQLRIRDNPVAGDVVGMLELGQKIKSYETIENWVRINKSGPDEKWVNMDFLTNSEVTWASYNRRNRSSRKGLGGPQIAGDVELDRIKVEGDKSGKLYAASLKQAASGNRVLVTWQKFRSGAHYSKYLVACTGETPSHVQILGEGYSYKMMEYDRRSKDVNVNQDMPDLPISSDRVSDKTRTIAAYSCGQ